MSDTIRDELISFKNTFATAFEKEVIELVLESSESYIEFKNFIRHFREHDLDSGLIPKLTSPSFCIEFSDRYYMQIEELLAEFEKEKGRAFHLGEDKLVKVSMAYFGFSVTFNNVLLKLEQLKQPKVEEDPRASRRKEIESNINYFTGTDKWHQIYPNILITDGIKFVFDTAQSYWLGEIVFSIQSLSKVKAEYFQFYNLEVDLEKSMGKLTVTDGNEKEIYTQTLPYTDFPLAKFRFYFTDGVILLPSEY